jgi:hypothetical protein
VDVHYSQFATIVKVRAEMDSAVWPYVERAFPPQGTQYYALPLADDAGREYATKSARGGTPRLDTATGKVLYDGELEFEPIDSTARTLTLRTRVSVFEVPVPETLILDLRGKSAGDEWSLQQAITVGGVSFALQTAQLSSITDHTAAGLARATGHHQRSRPSAGRPVVDLFERDPGRP